MPHLPTLIGVIVALGLAWTAAGFARRRGAWSALGALAVAVGAGGPLALLVGAVPLEQSARQLGGLGTLALWLGFVGVIFYSLCIGLLLRAWDRRRARHKGLGQSAGTDAS